jgi:hypothetical protein
MAQKKSQLDKVLEGFDAEIALLQAARARVAEQQMKHAIKKARRPKVVPRAGDVAASA